MHLGPSGLRVGRWPIGTAALAGAIALLAAAACSPRASRPVEPMTTGWLRWDTQGRGTLVGRPSTGPVAGGSRDVRGAVPLSLYVLTETAGVEIHNCVDVYIDHASALTVDGRRSREFRLLGDGRIAHPLFAEFRVVYEKRENHLYARSVDAVTDRWTDADPGFYPWAGRRSGLHPPAASRGASATWEDDSAILRLAALRPDEWLVVDANGDGFVRGVVAGGGQRPSGIDGDEDGAVTIVESGTLLGLPVASEVDVIVDRDSKAVIRGTGPSAVRMWDPAAASGAAEPLGFGGPSTGRSVYVVKRVGRRLYLRTAFFDPRER